MWKLAIVSVLGLCVLVGLAFGDDKEEKQGDGVKVKTRIGELTFSHDFVNGVPLAESRKKLFDELDFQRACQA